MNKAKKIFPGKIQQAFDSVGTQNLPGFLGRRELHSWQSEGKYWIRVEVDVVT